jgi:signal peptidase I
LFSRHALFEKAPRRGDIVAFSVPRDTGSEYIKRVIGLPGDRVRVAHGALEMNGRSIPRQLLGPREPRVGLKSYEQREAEQADANRREAEEARVRSEASRRP